MYDVSGKTIEIWEKIKSYKNKGNSGVYPFIIWSCCGKWAWPHGDR